MNDRQVVLRAYRRWGEAAPRRLQGPLSWILWDPDRSCLLAVRDREGMCGVYWCRVGERFYLSLDLPALLAALPRLPEVEPGAVAAHLHGQPPAPGSTFYRHLQCLEPGQALSVDRRGQRVEDYWRITLPPPLRLASGAEYAEALRETLLRVVADYRVPEAAGIALSGGLDSTTVAACLIHGREPGAAATAPDLLAYRWVAPELPGADEDRFSAAASSHLGLPEVVLRADQRWPLRHREGLRTERASPFLNLFADAWEETYADARERGLKTFYCGAGGDNLFGGALPTAPDLLLSGRWAAAAQEVRRAGAGWRNGMLRPLIRAYMARRGRRRGVRWLGPSLRRLWEQEERPGPPGDRLALPGRRLRMLHLRDRLLPPIGEAMNRQARRFGIELRHPLRDHRLAELAAALPAEQTVRGGLGKVVLRRAMAGLLPREVLELEGKIVPAAIAHRGLREREADKVWALLTDMRAAACGFVDEAALRIEYQRYLDGDDGGGMFWYSLTLEDWLRRYFD